MAEETKTEEEEETTEEETSETEEKEEEKSPEAIELEKMRASLKKANGEAAKFRNELKESRTKNESDAQKAVREAEEQTGAKFTKMLMNAEARAQLAEMGFTGKSERFLKMLDATAVTVDDDGEISGLKDQLLSIKTDFPEVFKKKVTSADSGPKKPADGAKGSSAERLLAQFND